MYLQTPVNIIAFNCRLPALNLVRLKFTALVIFFHAVIKCASQSNLSEEGLFWLTFQRIQPTVVGKHKVQKVDWLSYCISSQEA